MRFKYTETHKKTIYLFTNVLVRLNHNTSYEKQLPGRWATQVQISKNSMTLYMLKAK